MSSRSPAIWLMWTAAAVVLGLAVMATRPRVEPARDWVDHGAVPPVMGPLLSEQRSNAILTGHIQDPFFREPVGNHLSEEDEPPSPVVDSEVDALEGVRVAGIIGGPPWHAVLSGGAMADRAIVVSAGDSVASELVLEVWPDSVRLTGPAGARVLPVRGR